MNDELHRFLGRGIAVRSFHAVRLQNREDAMTNRQRFECGQVIGKGLLQIGLGCGIMYLGLVGAFIGCYNIRLALCYRCNRNEEHEKSLRA